MDRTEVVVHGDLGPLDQSSHVEKGNHRIARITELANLETKVVEVIRPLPRELSEPAVTVVLGVVGPLGHGVDDNVGAVEGQNPFNAVLREAGERLSDYLDVLLRHRLRRQPGGFEGLSLLKEGPQFDDGVVAHRNHIGEISMHIDSALLSATTFSDTDDDVVEPQQGQLPGGL